ncbi:phosphonate metabolism transcriptional regulator PhnF [Oceaniradius stylonematis]|jgi:GntR family phosphonate transport system transcriptional regulator|uniref:phosphonate metabolism transcriptional regulator PhnF n=1 Tax=Oceaniradius stylonematis TaxID=2184161 RepID=UPI0027401BF2|nr:phosphonate metabolism transcriptional regulator PhnF [Oceaniradius stylonematis]
MTGQPDRIERQSGIAMWRQIADAIRAGLSGPLVDADGKLPPEKVLAERFGVNRHTVRAAIRALAHEGAVQSHQGRGTFVRRKPRLTYPIGRRTRFSEGLEGQAANRGAELIAHRKESAPADIARALDIATGAPVIRLESLGLADGMPVSRATSWFDAGRFGAIADIFARSRSVTRALAQLGVTDYVRAWTRIEARHGAADDLDHLRLSPGAIVLVAEAVNADMDGRPVQYSLSRFAADRVSLQVDGG